MEVSSTSMKVASVTTNAMIHGLWLGRHWLWSGGAGVEEAMPLYYIGEAAELKRCSRDCAVYGHSRNARIRLGGRAFRRRSSCEFQFCVRVDADGRLRVPQDCRASRVYDSGFHAVPDRALFYRAGHRDAVGCRGLAGLRNYPALTRPGPRGPRAVSSG